MCSLLSRLEPPLCLPECRCTAQFIKYCLQKKLNVFPYSLFWLFIIIKAAPWSRWSDRLLINFKLFSFKISFVVIDSAYSWIVFDYFFFHQIMEVNENHPIPATAQKSAPENVNWVPWEREIALWSRWGLKFYILLNFNGIYSKFDAIKGKQQNRFTWNRVSEDFEGVWSNNAIPNISFSGVLSMPKKSLDKNAT